MKTAHINLSSPAPMLAPFTLELDRTIDYRIKPLRLGKWSWSFMVVSFVLPLAIGFFQIFAAA